MYKNQKVKIINQKGYLSLGKAFAGQTVFVRQIEEGVLLIKLAPPHSAASVSDQTKSTS